MATILILGGPKLAAPFAASVPDRYSLLIDGMDDGDMPGGRNALRFDHSAPFPADLAAVVELGFDRAASARNLEIVADACSSGAVFYTNVLTTTATEAASHLPGVNVIGISYVPALFASSQVLEAAPALQCDPDHAGAGIALLPELTGKEVEVVADRLGLISIRTLSMVVNEAAFALMEGVAGHDDIDTAMKLGTGYPQGPLRWADAIGPEIVLAVLQALFEEYGEERYRPCVLLRQFVRARRRFTSSAPDA